MYCDQNKEASDFSDEHVWPDSLGGDALPKKPWRLKVCMTCNHMSGVFVDGGFTKSWHGQMERSGASDISAIGGKTLPYSYMGRLNNLPSGKDEVIEYYTSYHSAVIVVRPKDKEDTWSAYAGGDPKRKKKRGFRAYILFQKDTKEALEAGLTGLKKQFKRYQRYVATPWDLEIKGHIDNRDHPYPQDREIIDEYTRITQAKERIQGRMIVHIGCDTRLLCKVGLALGYNLLGEDFLKSENCTLLRNGFREANFQKRSKLNIRGTGFQTNEAGGLGKILGIKKCWILVIRRDPKVMSLVVVSPHKNTAVTMISNDSSLFENLDEVYEEGVIWVVNPINETAFGPLGMSQYIAHITNAVEIKALTEFIKTI